MLEIVKKIEYDLYLVLLGVLSFLSYIGVLGQYLLPIYMVIALYFVIKAKSVLYVFPIAVFLQMGFISLRDNVEITTIYSLVFLFLLVVDTIKNRRITKLGNLFIPLAILVGLSIITIFNAPDLFTWFAGLSQIMSVLILYFYFINTIDDDKDNFINISKIFMYASMFVTFEMVHFLVQTDQEVIYMIQRRIIDLGWENLNIVIYSNILSIPLIGYLILKSKVKVPYMIFAVISIIGILLTLSRSSILTVGVMVVFLVPLMLLKEKNLKSLLIQGVIFLVIVGVSGLLLETENIVTGYFDTLFGRDLLRYEDRWVLLEVSWEMFKQYPIFGSGGYYSSRFFIGEFGYGSQNYHNTIAQASTLGITGVIGLVYLFVEKVRVMFAKKSDFKWFLFILIFTTAFVNGALQPMYFYTTYMIFIFMMLAAYENTTETA